LIVLEYEAVEVDYCVACRGVWLDGGELELLFGDRDRTAGFMTAGSAAAAHGEAPIRCPICRTKMKLETTGGDFPVTYDQCPTGDGLWFDGGELQTVLKHGSLAAGGAEVSAWLQDMFGEEQTPG
jgi:Zn-finger nucleic acid-binding protein